MYWDIFNVNMWPQAMVMELIVLLITSALVSVLALVAVKDFIDNAVDNAVVALHLGSIAKRTLHNIGFTALHFPIYCFFMPTDDPLTYKLHAGFIIVLALEVSRRNMRDTGKCQRALDLRNGVKGMA